MGCSIMLYCQAPTAALGATFPLQHWGVEQDYGQRDLISFTVCRRSSLSFVLWSWVCWMSYFMLFSISWFLPHCRFTCLIYWCTERVSMICIHNNVIEFILYVTFFQNTWLKERTMNALKWNLLTASPVFIAIKFSVFFYNKWSFKLDKKMRLQNWESVTFTISPAGESSSRYQVQIALTAQNLNFMEPSSNVMTALPSLLP